jgi:hypothetical protein
MGKVSASPKAQAVEKRLNEVVIPALAGTAPIVTSGNASFLATLQGASDPIAAGSLGLSFTGPGGTQSVANLYSYLNGGFATLMGNLLAYTDALGTCVNSIISSGSTAGIWP